MANIKSYKIEINGIQESINAVDALNKELSTLEQRIKALEGKAVKVGASGGGSKSSSTSSLSEEEKLQKQINQLEEKRIAHSKQIYQNYLAAKDVLKETENDQKQIAATERLQAQNYSNTMAGMKQELADIKAVMQTVDLGDGDQMKQMVTRANELNSKLKEIEQSYGQFGRNVGNYANGVAEGLKKVSINVGGTVREFDNAKQAAKILGNELKTMAVNGEQNTEKFKQLRQVVLELESTMKDAKQPMDALMDTMQSITAIASLGQGVRALFGVNDAEIQKSIKNLVALQNILKGIETINKQIQTREGIGAWIAPFNTQIDKATAKLLTFNTALLGTGKASKAAAVSIKAFSKALKVAFSAGVLIVVDLLVEGLMKIVEGFKKVDEATERHNALQKDLASTYGEAKGKLMQYRTTVDNFNGSKEQEKKLVEELNNEFGSTLGTYKSLAQWQDVLKKKGDAYIQTLVNQAKAQAALNEVTAAYMNIEDVKQKVANGEYKSFWKSRQQEKEAEARAIEEANDRIAKAEDNLKKVVAEGETYAKKHGLGNYAPTIIKNGKKSADATKKAQEDITKKQIDAMKDGLNKTLMQLEEEKRQTINKIKENGVRVSQLVAQTEEVYAQLRIKAINEYLEKLTKTVKDYSVKISGIRFQIDTKDIELQINEIDEYIRSVTEDIVPVNNTLTTSLEYQAAANGLKQENIDFAGEFNYERNKAKTEKDLKEYFKWLDEYVQTLSQDVRESLSYQNLETGELKTDYNEVEKYIEEHYKKELSILDSYGYKMNSSLSASLAFRLNAIKAYDKEFLREINEALDKEQGLRISAATEEEKNLLLQNDENYRIESHALKIRKKEIEESLKAIEKLYSDSEKKISDSFRKSHEEEIKILEEANGKKIETYKDYYNALSDSLKNNLNETNRQIEEIDIQHADKMEQITRESGQKIIQIENETIQKRQQNTQRYYDKQLSNYRDFLSKINNESSKQPVTDKAGFGIVNIAATKRNYKEILDAAKTTLINIKGDKDKLNEDFKNGLISSENYNATLNQLNDLEVETNQTAKTVADNLKNVNGTFVQSLQMYLQEVLNSFNTIMGAIWDAQDTAFDKEQEALDKESEMIQNALDKQEDMISEHKSKIDSIEDELATSRGDRRQHLIDQLNAEVEAERAALKEKQRLEKIEEANKKKQEALEKKRKKAQYERDIIQAIVNGAMAVTYAAMNAWPIPAIPLMALAGATTAAQLAIMSANKPYATGGQLDGGVAVGNRHRDGGIKVLGGRAEIEGGEFITNRLTTAKNLDLLEYVNSKKKKIDISDMLEFYNGGKVKTSIQRVRTKFEDGGYMPTLPDALDIRDQLQNIIVNQDNRPIYVSVVDINNKQDDVRRVQTLAGIE